MNLRIFAAVLLALGVSLGSASAQTTTPVPRLSSVGVSPASAKPGELVTVNLVFTNDTPASSGTGGGTGGTNTDQTVTTVQITLFSNKVRSIDLGVFPITIPAIPAGQSKDVKVSATIPSQTSDAGAYFVQANAAIGGSTSTTTAAFSITGKPDLQIAQLVYSPGTYAPLERMPMSITYRNNSSANGEPSVPFLPSSPAAFRIDVVLSTDPIYGNADDFRLTFFDVSEIIEADGADHTINWTQIMPGNFAGTYFVLAKIDSLDVVDETVETDLQRNGNNIYSDSGAAKIITTSVNFPTVYHASVALDETPGNAASQRPSLDQDGRYVAFYSEASNLVSGDSNQLADVFVKDSATGVITRISTSSNGQQGNGRSLNPAISGNGRYVVFQSEASNLVGGLEIPDTNGFADIFRYDNLTGQIRRVSLGAGGVQANNTCANPAISGDGRIIVFESTATNLVGSSVAGRSHVYLYDSSTDTIRRISAGPAEGNGGSFNPAVSFDGAYVVFASDASNLVAGDGNGRRDIFLYDVSKRTLRRVSVPSGGAGEADGASTTPTISGDGRHVAYSSTATNLDGFDSNGVPDIYVTDTVTLSTVRVSVPNSGGEASDTSLNPVGSITPSISTNGRYVAYASLADNLADGDYVGEDHPVVKDGNFSQDIYVYDRDVSGSGTFDASGNTFTTRVSVNRFGYQTINVLGEQSSAASLQPAISGSGRFVAYSVDAEGSSGVIHAATNRISPDSNRARDVVIYDRRLNSLPGPGFNNPPTVSITAPTASSSLVVNNQVTITASATDSDGSVAQVQFFVDNQPLGAPITTPPYRTTWTPSTVGAYSISAVATDNRGNRASSPIVVVGVEQAGLTTSSAAVYKGSYNAGAGEIGQFVLYVDRNKKATLIAYSTSPAGRVHTYTGVSVETDGTFVVRNASGAIQLQGNVSATGGSGTFQPTAAGSNGAATFVGPVTIPTASNPLAPAAFSGTLEGASSGTVLAIIGADRSVFLHVTSGSTQDVASGTIAANGQFTVNTPAGNRYSGTYVDTAGLLSGTVTGKLNGSFVCRQTAARLSNLSSRALAGTGSNVLIAGFIVGGSGGKPVLIRAVGPTLNNFGVNGAMVDPELRLFRGSESIGYNDDWREASLATTAARVGAFPLPANSKDAALEATLQPGAYTVQVAPRTGSPGVSLIEIYDAGGTSDVKMTNLSVRGWVGTDGNVLISGLVVSGDNRKRFLIRAVGPTLGLFGVGGVLADPKIEVLSGSDVIRSNDDWNLGVSSGDVAAVTEQLGAFTLVSGSKDAGLVVSLEPGAYTVRVTGAGSSTGIVLLEIYEVP